MDELSSELLNLGVACMEAQQPFRPSPQQALEVLLVDFLAARLDISLDVASSVFVRWENHLGGRAALQNLIALAFEEAP